MGHRCLVQQKLSGADNETKWYQSQLLLLFTIGGAVINALAFSWTNFLFSTLMDLD